MKQYLGPTAERCARAVRKLYENLPEDQHEHVDTLRDELANALGVAGMGSSSEFNAVARGKG